MYKEQTIKYILNNTVQANGMNVHVHVSYYYGTEKQNTGLNKQIVL